MSKRIDLPDVVAAMRAYQAAKLSASELQFGLAEMRSATPIPPPFPEPPRPTASEILATRLADQISSTERKGEDFDLLVDRVLRCVESVGDPDEALDLLPLIVHHDDFSVLLSKYRRGLIPQAGLRSIIVKRFPFDEHRWWLEEASVDQLQDVVDLLEADDFEGLNRMLRD